MSWPSLAAQTSITHNKSQQKPKTKKNKLFKHYGLENFGLFVFLFFWVCLFFLFFLVCLVLLICLVLLLIVLAVRLARRACAVRLQALARMQKWRAGVELSKKIDTLLDLSVSSLRRGHANLLCVVPILTDDLRRESALDRRGLVLIGRVSCAVRSWCSGCVGMRLPAGGSGCGQKADSTLRYSQAVPDPSTNQALRHLTSEVKRDPVHSTRYGRQRQLHGQAGCCSRLAAAAVAKKLTAP